MNGIIYCEDSMFLIDKSIEELGLNPETCSSKKKVYCQCDYCGQVTLRLKETVVDGRHTVNKDACNDKNCMKKKRQETTELKYGSKNYTETEEFKEKAKQTNLERYGVENYNQCEEARKKIEQACLEKYGSTSYLATEKSKQERKQICLEKYGVDHYSKSEERQEKVKQTYLKNWGVEHYSQTEEFKIQTKQTCADKYGVTNYSKTNEYKDKVVQTSLEKYGKEHFSKTDEYKEIARQSNLERYGVENYSSTEECRDKVNKTNLAKFGTICALNNDEVKAKAMATNRAKYNSDWYFGTEKALEDAKNTCLEKYGVEFYSQTEEFKKRVMKTCLEKYGVPNTFYLVESCEKTENEISEFLTQFNFKFKKDREILDGKEIDFFDADKKIGIEYCGLYWHNEFSKSPRGKQYHYDKWLKCKEKNIRLITMFEDEWQNRKNQCKNFLKSILGVSQRKFHARKCQIKEIQNGNSFISEHHILDSNKLSKICYGIFNNEELLGCMSLGRHHRLADKKTIVLDRLCFASGVQVLGGASRLLNALKIWAKENNYDKIITWSDNRWSEGDVYLKMGFLLDKEYGPDYSYYDMKNKCRKSKQSQKKQNTSCPANTTEREWSMKNGLARIWDCGKKRWIYNL